MSYNIFNHCFAAVHDAILHRANELDMVDLTDEAYCTRSVSSMPDSWKRVLQQERDKAEDEFEVTITGEAARGALFRAALTGGRINLTHVNPKFPLFSKAVMNPDHYPNHSGKLAMIWGIQDGQFAVVLCRSDGKPDIDQVISGIPSDELDAHLTPVKPIDG